MKIIIITIFVLIASVKITAQMKVTSFSPSAFYTNSNYSDGGSANAVSEFATVGFNYKDFVTLGYDKLLINHPTGSISASNGWKYDQQMFTFGGTKNIYPFYLGFYYSYITGEYKSKPAGFSYTDKLNVLDVNLLFNKGFYFIGLSGNYITLDGIINLNIEHYTAVVKRLIGTKFLFAATFTKSIISDGRNLNSVKIDINYKISNLFSIDGSGAFGERAYFYDDTILTIFNQNETQKLNVSLTLKYLVSRKLTFITNYTYSDFSTYNINYFSGGIKYLLML